MSTDPELLKRLVEDTPLRRMLLAEAERRYPIGTAFHSKDGTSQAVMQPYFFRDAGSGEDGIAVGENGHVVWLSEEWERYNHVAGWARIWEQEVVNNYDEY